MSIGRGIRRRRLTLHGRMGLRTPVDSTFSSRGPRTIQIIENVDIIQIFASVQLLLRVDHPRYLSAWRKVICQHYRISEIVNWFFFWSWRTRRKKELFYAILVRESTGHLQWGDYERGAQKPVNTAKNYICQSSYIIKVRRSTIHAFPQYVQRGHMQAYRTCRVTYKLDVRMHVSDEYGVLYAKRFGRLLGIKV